METTESKSSYDIRREEEERQQKLIIGNMVAAFNAMGALGYNFDVVLEENGIKAIYQGDRRFNLWAWTGRYRSQANKIEVSISIDPERDENGKWLASVSPADYLTYEERKSATTRISFTPTKPAETIARDIAKRLMPLAVRVWAAADKRIKENLEAFDNKKVAIAKVKEVLGIVADDTAYCKSTDSPYYRFKTPSADGYSKVTINPDGRISIELNYLPTEEGLKVLRLLQAKEDN